MKKTTCFFLSLLLLLLCGATAFASNNESGTTVVSTTISPTYQVTIPANKPIKFNTLSTNIGSVTLEAAQLEPYHVVHVSASYGKLQNSVDGTKTISYTLKSGENAFTGADFSIQGQSVALVVEITQSAWNAAFAGNYSDKITFTWSYVDQTPKE